jgi:hypothetical protein
LGGAGGPGAGGPGGGGSRFGGNSNLTQAVAYAKAHGGGTVVVSSQQGASDTIITADPAQPADVAAIGGYSGRESEVSIQWLADAVRDGRIRWVLTDGSGGGGGRADARTGSTTVMAAAARVGTAVDLTAGGTGSTTTGTAATGVLYDLQGQADALQALAR